MAVDIVILRYEAAQARGCLSQEVGLPSRTSLRVEACAHGADQRAFRSFTATICRSSPVTSSSNVLWILPDERFFPLLRA